MPLRNEFPTLYELALRKLSWPDAIGRKEGEPYPSRKAYARNTIELAYIKDKDNTLNKLLEQKQLENLSNTIVNSWIRLSNYYKTPLIEFRQNALFLALQPVTCLDFLNNCTKLLHRVDAIPNFSSLIGFIPCTSIPQKVDSQTWIDIVDILNITKADSDIEELSIYFGKSEKKIGSPSFDFSKTIQGFFNLRKLIVHGEANDNLMQTVGRCCTSLEYLDIRGTRITEEGILKLLFKRPQNAKKYIKVDDTDRVMEIPQYMLRPLTMKLAYFDMSTIKKSRILYEHYHPVLVACPSLVVTQRAFFFRPNGESRVVCKITDDSIAEFHMKVMQKIRSPFCLPLLDFIRELKTFFPLTEFEVRVNEIGEEVGFLFYHKRVLVVYLEVEHYSCRTITSYASSALAFFPVDLIKRFCPTVQYIKSSLGYIGDVEKGFQHLKSVTAAVVETKDVLYTIIRHCKILKYLEVREILKAAGPVDDEDIKCWFAIEKSDFEVLRFLFKNEITLCGGIKTMLTMCRHMRIIGDVKYFNISHEHIMGSLISLSLHNYEFMYEYNGTLHHTTTPYGQLYSTGEFFETN